MRNYLIWLMGDKVTERNIEAKELEEAEEIIMTNAVKGIQWVKELNGKAYSNKKAIQLTELLNSKLMGLAQ